MASNVNGNVSSYRYCPACGAANPLQAKHCAACHEPFFDVTAGRGAKTNPLTGLLLPAVVLYQRYCILEVLSTDEVSTVYKAEDIRLGNRVVALKEIGKNNANTQEAVALIEEGRREMLTLAGLVHPNLPRIYDYFVEDQRWYFVMDFLAGETLAAYLQKRKNRPLPQEEVIDAGIQLSTVLDYLHIHQPPLGFNDLNLDTIWRTPDGKLYLLEVGAPSSEAAMPQRSSIYGLGKLLGQLETGRIVGHLRPHISLARPRTRSKRQQASSLRLLLRQMVHKNVSKRPYTMGMVKQELQHLATQLIPIKKRRFSRRTLLKLGGLAGLAAGSSWLTQQVIFTTRRDVPHPGYSPNLGGTLYSYDASSQVLGVAWSPNGRRIVLAASGADWGHVQSWDANTGQHVVIYRDPDLQQQIETVTWLPNGKSIVAAGDDSIVFVWDAATGDRQGLYRGHSGMVITVASSPDSQYIASGGADHTVQVWEVATGRWITVYGEHLDSIGSVAWSPDGKYIASASFDRTVRIWEAATGNTIYTYSRHTDKVYAVAWSPDGKHIASGGLDKTVQVWPVALFEKTGQGKKHSIMIYRGHSRAIQDIAWSPGPVSRILDNRTIASAADNVQLWNGLTGAKIFTYAKHAVNVGLEVQTVAWSPNGKYIASGGMEGTVQVWNATSNNFPAHGNG